MTKNTINIGDRVLSCIPWTPGLQITTQKRGEGIVTLITEGDGSRRVRVLWKTGVLEWHPENELVNVKNVK